MCRDYSPPDSYYERDEYYDRSCSSCDDKESSLAKAQAYLEAIVKMLYSTEDLDLLTFEDNLDELCHQLDVKLIPADLQIQRLRKKTRTNCPSLNYMDTFLDLMDQRKLAAK